MFKHEFEVYKFNDLPENVRQGMVQNAGEMYGQNQEIHDTIIDNMMTGTLYIRVETDEEKDMFLPIPVMMCSSGTPA